MPDGIFGAGARSTSVSPGIWPHSRISPRPWSASSSRATRSPTSGPSRGHTPVRSAAGRHRATSHRQAGGDPGHGVRGRCATGRSSSTTSTTTTWPSWLNSARPAGRDVMAETHLLQRLTASDLFVLLWDDFGWSGDIGALAILRRNQPARPRRSRPDRGGPPPDRVETAPRPAVPAAAVPTATGAGLAAVGRRTVLRPRRPRPGPPAARSG